MNDYSKTYCNPTPLPDYPMGKWAYRESASEPFRESADPTVIYHDGKWYLYPSCGERMSAYVSSDFVTWEHHFLNLPDIGYAPTAVLHKGKFYFAASGSDLYVSASPLGPFKSAGRFTHADGTECCPSDVMLFSDDDERLYMYWGSGEPGIFGLELDADNPTRAITPPKLMFSYNPNHIWERLGEWNEDERLNYNEGPWMVKVNGRYFLTYAAPGTEFSTYAMGTYACATPLGDFEYQQLNPILCKTEGIVRGPGHGCLVKGPNDTLWAFYTCLVGYASDVERRVGYDPAGIDENGNLFVRRASEIPQWAPGLKDRPQLCNDAGLLPVTFRSRPRASSSVSGRDPIYAVDDSMLTWWQPEAGDPEKALYLSLPGLNPGKFGKFVAAMRLMWRDVGLDPKNGVCAGAFQYKLEGRTNGGEWEMLVDATENKTDMLIDYRTFEPMLVNELRLTVTGYPEGIQPGVINLTVFGRTNLPL